jgi:hypothetical protein
MQGETEMEDRESISAGIKDPVPVSSKRASCFTVIRLHETIQQPINT